MLSKTSLKKNEIFIKRYGNMKKKHELCSLMDKYIKL